MGSFILFIKYQYDNVGNLRKATDSTGAENIFTYDSEGHQLSQTRQQQGGSDAVTATATYDKNGNKRFETDGNGNMLTMTDKTGTTGYAYDEENRTLTKTVSGIGEISWQYDILEGNGRVAEKATDPKGNITVKVYDKTDRLAAVTAEGGTTSYSYYANGSRKSVTYPDGSTENYTYYKDNLNKTLVNKKANGTVIDSYSYTYDAAHNQTSKTDAKGVTGYTYDKLNRLETVTEPGNKTTSYTYDGAGNRLTEAVITGISTITTTYSYDTQNRMVGTVTEENGTTERVKYNYDNNGNLVYKAKVTTKPADMTKQGSFAISVSGISGTEEISVYEYDKLNQLIKTTSGGKTISYKYNGLGQRVEKTVNTQTTKYLYEGDKVVLELDGQGNQTARNVQGTNTIARTAEGETLYYMYNGHGDVTALLDAAGTIAATYYYDAFGNPIDTTGEASNPFRYAGYQYDEETGIYYLNARYYDPKIARFLTEDTYLGSIADPLSLNLYTYCHNEPVMYYDPTGHATVTWEGYIIDIDDSELEEYQSHGWAEFDGNAYCDSMNNFADIDEINTSDYSDTDIFNGQGASIGTINTGVGSTTHIDNHGNVGTVNTGANSHLHVNNYDDNDNGHGHGHINVINSGAKSTSDISNYGMIGVFNTGAHSMNNIFNSSIILGINTGIGNTTRICSDGGTIGYGGGKGKLSISGTLAVNTGDKLVDIAFTKWWDTHPQSEYGDDPRYSIMTVAAFQNKLLYMSAKGMDVSKLSIDELYELFEDEANFQAGATMAMSGAAVAMTKNAGITVANAVAQEGAGKSVGKGSEVANLLDNMPELTGSTREKLLSTVQNTDLSKIVNELYRPGATVGDGGTAAKLMQEFYEGSSTHLTKAQQRLSQLNNLAKSGKLGLNDMDILEALRNDLNNAVNLFK